MRGEVGSGRAESGGRLRLLHRGLPLLAEERFQAPLSPHRLVTFLNRALKRRGLVFGLTQDGEGLCVRIYETTDGQAPDARKEGDGDGHERDGNGHNEA